MILARQAAKSLRGIAVGTILVGAAAACRPAAEDPAGEFASDSPPEVIADSLISLWIDSLGGMETYRKFESASYTITTVIYDTLSGRVKRTRPRYVWIKKGPYGQETRVERWEGDDFIVQGFNGRDGWATLTGEFLPDTAKDWRETRYVAADLFYWPGLPYKLRDDGVSSTTVECLTVRAPCFAPIRRRPFPPQEWRSITPSASRSEKMSAITRTPGTITSSLVKRFPRRSPTSRRVARTSIA